MHFQCSRGVIVHFQCSRGVIVHSQCSRGVYEHFNVAVALSPAPIFILNYGMENRCPLASMC